MADDVVTVYDTDTDIVEVEVGSNIVTAVIDSQTEVIAIVTEGPPGPQGESGAATYAAYEHDQPIASADWTINHPLPFRPNVSIVDTTGRLCEGVPEYPDASTVVVHFSSAFAGTAYLS